jgi:hypothetical protein
MAAYKMATVKFTPPNDFPLGLMRPHVVDIYLLLVLCYLQRVVIDTPHPVDYFRTDTWLSQIDLELWLQVIYFQTLCCDRLS